MTLLLAVQRLVHEDSGQDVVEYALLSAFIGFVGVAAFSGMGAVMKTAYDSWVVSADAVADMPPPLTGGS